MKKWTETRLGRKDFYLEKRNYKQYCSNIKKLTEYEKCENIEKT